MSSGEHLADHLLEALAQGHDVPAEARKHAEGCPSCAKAVAQRRENDLFLADLAAGMRTRPRPIDGYPENVPGYRILGELSSGGQGVVYRAVQERTGRIVALKVLGGGWLASPRQRRRFEREIEIAGGLNHPNIATVYDAVELRTGLGAFAMELIDGVPLDQWRPDGTEDGSTAPRVGAALGAPSIEAGASELQQSDRAALSNLPTIDPPANAAVSVSAEPPSAKSPTAGRWHEDARTRAARLRVFAKACGAVHHAHLRGIIHRDLKPSNILADARGEPHILDFGIAVFLQEDPDGRITQSGEFTGTVEFASPEQAAGLTAEMDVRSDVYSLGVILYVMLTRRLPYPMIGPTRERLEVIRISPPVRPSTVVQSLRGDLEVIVLRALAKEPKDRYQSAEDLRRDIENFLSGEPIAARRDSAWYVLRKKARKHWKAAVVAGLLLLSTGTGAGVFLHQRSASAKLLAAEQAQKVELVSRLSATVFGAIGSPGDEASAGRVDVAARRATVDLVRDNTSLSLEARAQVCLSFARALLEQNLTSSAQFQLEVARGLLEAGGTDPVLRDRVERELEAVRAKTMIRSTDSATPAERAAEASRLVGMRADTALVAAEAALAAVRADPASGVCARGDAADVLARARLLAGLATEARAGAEEALAEAEPNESARACVARLTTTIVSAHIAEGRVDAAWRVLAGRLASLTAGGDPLAGVFEFLGEFFGSYGSDEGPLTRIAAPFAEDAAALLRAWSDGSAQGILARVGDCASHFASVGADAFGRWLIHTTFSALPPRDTDPRSVVGAEWDLARAGITIVRRALDAPESDPHARAELADGGTSRRRREVIGVMEELAKRSPESLARVYEPPQMYRDHETFGSHWVRACAAAGDWRKAAEAKLACLDADRRSNPGRPPELTDSLHAARLLCLAGRHEEARRRLDELRSGPPGDDMREARIDNTEVLALITAGHGRAAVELAELIGARTSAAPAALPYLLLMRCHRAMALNAAGRAKEAATALDDLLSEVRARPDADDWRYVFEAAEGAYRAAGREDGVRLVRRWLGEDL